MHPPYSPDFAQSDYQLFLSMANGLTGEKLVSSEPCETRYFQYFFLPTVANEKIKFSIRVKNSELLFTMFL